MKPSSKRILGLAAVLAVALVIVILLRQPGPSDQDQIRTQLETARAAAQRHDANGIMKIVSADYHGSTPFDGNNDGLALFLRRVVGGRSAATVSLSPPSVSVQADTAVTVGQVTARDDATGRVLYDQPVTLNWRREDGTRWLVFPAKVWRVTGGQYRAPGGDEGGGLF